MISSAVTGRPAGPVQVAVVTGANKGIGHAIARQLSELGMTVYLGARHEGRGQAAEAELRAAGLDGRFVQLDVTDESTVRLAAERIEEESGTLDVLVPPRLPVAQVHPPLVAAAARDLRGVWLHDASSESTTADHMTTTGPRPRTASSHLPSIQGRPRSTRVLAGEARL
ncbi:SDR family NAD(P)-dependent oxidoreductase [Nonomuraea sp. NPDC026600]|uniref:SDR family NAD(P)-dependent oxidoreductase n=1 Tax=Nonomuraea sp. NPDC026600 TaxID=3155363 RepID=UPI0033EF5A59